MKRYILTKAVTIRGYAFPSFPRKRPAQVVLSPVAMGWFWNGVPITNKLLQLRKRRIAFKKGEDTLDIVEHLLALRMSGLDGVDIRCDGELPFDGCAAQFWGAVYPAMTSDGIFPRYTVRKICTATPRNHKKFPRHVIFEPLKDGEEPALTLKIHIDYPGLGPYDYEWSPDCDSFADIAYAKSPGWPPILRPLLKIGGGAFGWPHNNDFSWHRELPPEEACLQFAKHRTIDISGGLAAIVPPGGMIAGTIRSHCAGHACDLSLNQDVEDSGGFVRVT